MAASTVSSRSPRSAIVDRRRGPASLAQAYGTRTPYPVACTARFESMSARAKLPHVNPWLVLVLVCLAQFMVILDATIVNVALPTIQQDLDMTDTSLHGS